MNKLAEYLTAEINAPDPRRIMFELEFFHWLKQPMEKSATPSMRPIAKGVISTVAKEGRPASSYVPHLAGPSSPKSANAIKTSGTTGAAIVGKTPVPPVQKIAGVGQWFKDDLENYAHQAEWMKKGLTADQKPFKSKPGWWEKWRDPKRAEARQAGESALNAFDRGRGVHRGTGAATMIDELNVKFRNNQNRFSPSSILSGLNETGLVTPESVMRGAGKTIEYARGTSAKTLEVERRNNILKNVGIGAGGLVAGGLAFKALQKNRNDQAG